MIHSLCCGGTSAPLRPFAAIFSLVGLANHGLGGNPQARQTTRPRTVHDCHIRSACFRLPPERRATALRARQDVFRPQLCVRCRIFMRHWRSHNRTASHGPRIVSMPEALTALPAAVRCDGTGSVMNDGTNCARIYSRGGRQWNTQDLKNMYGCFALLVELSRCLRCRRRLCARVSVLCFG